jgi:hypothetical protein
MMDDQPEFLDLTPDSEAEPTASVPLEAEPNQVLPSVPAGSSKAVITFQGNSYDLASVVGVTIGAMVLL